MSASYKLDGVKYAEMLRGGAVNLRNNAQTVNELNVFPIPDGDTGENMSRTVEGGVAAVETAHELDIGKASGKAADGMLLSARGNSGVILSQFFEGVRRGFDGVKEAGVAELKAAFASGVKQAYSAVVQPTEGTILTVMREACEKAAGVGSGASIEEYFDVFIDEAYDSLERTPELLPVLKEAEVIDSGGAGLVYILEGMRSALMGGDMSDLGGVNHGGGITTANVDSAAADKFTADSEMPFGYCTELIVQLMSSKTDVEKYDVKELIAYLESIGGDSVVAFKTGTRIKLHVHTFEPDKVFAYCRSIGEFVAVKVENMSIQHSESVVRNRFERQSASKKNKKQERKKYACVAVADGKGLIEQFRAFGADYVIDGKQTMNPSTRDFIDAFDAVNADSIFVLPNNANVLLAANQAAAMYEKSLVTVIQSSTLAEGFSALSMLDYSSDNTDAIAEAFTAAVNSVTTGLLSYAIRDCSISGKHVAKGDFLGFAGKTFVASAKTVAECACALLDGIDKTDKAVIIAIRGKDTSDADVAAMSAHLKKTAPDIEFYDIQGDQDVFSYVFVVE